MRPTVSLPPRRKACRGYISTLKIHSLRPGLNLRTLGPMASTLSTRLTKTTKYDDTIKGMRWEEYVARMKGREIRSQFWMANLKGRENALGTSSCRRMCEFEQTNDLLLPSKNSSLYGRNWTVMNKIKWKKCAVINLMFCSCLRNIPPICLKPYASH
jgi:hypothetical protein